MDHRAEAPSPSVLPDAGFDLVVFGFDARVEWDFSRPLEALAVAARDTGKETQTPRTRGRPGHHSFSLDVYDDEKLVGELELDLHMARSGGHLVTTGSSSISLNPQRILRRVWAWEPPAEEQRFDGGTNSLPLDCQGRLSAGAQLDAVRDIFAEVVIPFLDELWAAAPRRLERLWIKRGEACFDRHDPNAVAVVRAAATTLFLGARETQRSAYSRGALDRGGVPVVWWRDTKVAPTLKVYASAPATIRHEVACRSREEVNELVGVMDAPFSPDGARSLLLDFASAAEGVLGRVREHTAAAAAHGTLGELVLALGELIDFSRGIRRGPGRPCRPETIGQYRQALEQLLSSGFCDLTGADPTGGVVAALNRLVNAGYAVRHHTRQVYALTPRLAGAIGASLRPPEGPPAAGFSPRTSSGRKSAASRNYPTPDPPVGATGRRLSQSNEPRTREAQSLSIFPFEA